MALLQHHPIAVRKKIALMWTGGILLILIVIMVIRYNKPARGDDVAITTITSFYTTVIEGAQSYFVGK